MLISLRLKSQNQTGAASASRNSTASFPMKQRNQRRISGSESFQSKSIKQNRVLMILSIHKIESVSCLCSGSVNALIRPKSVQGPTRAECDRMAVRRAESNDVPLKQLLATQRCRLISSVNLIPREIHGEGAEVYCARSFDTLMR